LALVKSEARVARDTQTAAENEKQFALMLNLSHRLDEVRKNYKRHRNAHLGVQ
jgi:hypothetical protein